MNIARKIANALSPHIRANNAAIGETNRRVVRLGDGLGNPRPDRPLTPREVYYRSDLDQNDRGVAVLGDKCPIPMQGIEGYYDVPVYIANVPGSSQPVMSGLAEPAGLTTGQATPMEALVNVAAFPDLSRIVWFRLRPPVGGGMAIYVDVGPYAVRYEDANGNTAFFRSLDFGFADPTDGAIYRPTTIALAAGQHRLIGIAFDPASGIMLAIPGAAAATANTLPSQESRTEFQDADCAAIDFTGLYPCGYVYSYYLQTDVVEDDCMRHFDPRVLMSKAGAGASASIANVVSDRYGHVVMDRHGKLVLGRY